MNMRLKTKAMPLLVTVLLSTQILLVSSECGNSKKLKMKFRKSSGKVLTKKCKWLPKLKSREKFCNYENLLDESEPVWKTCSEQCQAQSQCGKPTPVPTSAPTDQPTSPRSCPQQHCSDEAVTRTEPYQCDKSLEMALLETYTYTNDEGSEDQLVELWGPMSPADAANLVISAPHGGALKPEYIPDRDTDHPDYCPSSGCRVFADSYTAQVAAAVQQKFLDNYCKVPYLVVNQLHRSKLDANREKGEAAHGNAIAEGAWKAFHDFISTAQTFVKDEFGTSTGSTSIEGANGLLFDVHGYAGRDWDPEGSPLIQWGYRLAMDTSLDTNQFCPVDDRSSGSISTLTHARFLPDQSMECLVRGPSSIPARLTQTFGSINSMCGKGTPSLEYPSPLELAQDCAFCKNMCEDDAGAGSPCYYYSGGYDVDVHERLNWETGTGVYFNAVQAELPRCIRFGGTSVHEEFADELSIALKSFLENLFGA